ncbi:hypothetical protein ACQ4LE_007602 [Meloidogyne hapla]|uniref:VWFC domain-containing protein n=1 Tax=Meloidogyne hapla TaxID=6305 RepID=A0A1I8AZY3_MELHA
MFLLLFLILFAKQEATKLPIDNNTLRNISEANFASTEISASTLQTTEEFSSTMIMKDENKATKITETNNKNETEKENETKEEIEANNKTEAKNRNQEDQEIEEFARQENSTEDYSSSSIEEDISSSTETSTATSTSDRCLNVECPIAFPDCPSDSLPILNFNGIDDSSSLDENCCASTRVECKCDPQKCLAPTCPEGTELTLTHNGIDKPGHCCDQFECRIIEPNCQNVRCPDTSSMILDLYSPDGHTCPDDSYRPKSYIPTGGCCPIISQCQCKLSICEPALCLPEQQLLILERGLGEPGHCCDKFKCVNDGDEVEGFFLEESSNNGCRYGDHIYAKGEHWHAAPCQECECSSAGVALCKRMECPALSPDCQWVGLSPGECCPVCLGCSDDNDKNYLPGSNWDRDGCTNCTCGGENFDFHWQCQKFICQTECEWPRPPKTGSECCPVCEDGPTIALEPSFSSSCPSLTDCNLRCQFGLQQNHFTGCFECKCAGENIIGIEENGQQQNSNITKCEALTKENCPRFCAHGYSLNNDGCYICNCTQCPSIENTCHKHCIFGFETNNLGCPICKCKTSAILESEKVETHSLTHCSATTNSREMGEWWNENCRQCFCHMGKEFCSLISCPEIKPEEINNCPEESWNQFDDECCPRCLTSSSSSSSSSSISLPISSKNHNIPKHQFLCYSPGTGQLYVDGQTWKLGENDCLSCTCRMGHVLCVWNDFLPCPPTPCEHPVFDPNIDKCCARCPQEENLLSSTSSSSSHQEFLENKQNGETVKTEETELTTSSSSFSSSSSTSFCSDKISSSNSSSARQYQNSSIWRRDDCRSCKCFDGNIKCFREHCKTENCRSGKWLSVKGRCCPLCADLLVTYSNNICLYNEHAYSVGEHFQDGPFRNCSCLPGGMLKCIEVHCPPCSSHLLSVSSSPPVISTTAKIKNDEQIETTTETFISGISWCLQQCLQQQQKENNKEQQQQLGAFERGSEQTLLFENRQHNNVTAARKGNNNNTKHLHHHQQQQQQQTWPQPHWLFIIAALIVGIPAFALLFLFAIYLLLAAFNSKYRRCGKERNIEQAMMSTNPFINNNNKWHFSQLLPKNFAKEKQQNIKNTSASKSVSKTNNDSLIVKVSLLGINKNKEEENEEEK